jgi:DNA helicase II / ATP-dependent DNA helicase PcrA
VLQIISKFINRLLTVQNYLEQLNGAQKDAVISTEGPSLVIAGAGSGKTRVLTYRIAYLLSKGVAPWHILALTFTNKAAREMKERIGTIVGKDTASRLWMGTFHSVFARILRVEAQHLQYPSSFTIYDTTDSKSLIKSILKEMQIKEKEYKPGLILSRISGAKNDLVLPAAYARDQNRMTADRASRVSMVYEIYLRYMKACVKAGAMDFDDLLLNTNLLFRDHPEVLAKYQQQFKYILVDEYQDTNFSQYLIVRKLAEQHKNVCVVGDDAQSIYSFRGAKIENILNFRNDYPEYQLFKLEQNYRSTQTIVNAANSIISNNKGQIRKVVFRRMRRVIRFACCRLIPMWKRVFWWSMIFFRGAGMRGISWPTLPFFTAPMHSRVFLRRHCGKAAFLIKYMAVSLFINARRSRICWPICAWRSIPGTGKRSSG